MRGKCTTCIYKSDKCRMRSGERAREALQYDATLCWCCKNAVPEKDDKGRYTAGCEWSIHKRPVEGWEVSSEALIFMSGHSLRTYCVAKCPKFERG